jgi:putative membrane protein
MVTAFGLSSIFLVSYVLYHFQAASTLFGDLNADHTLDDVEKVAVGNVRYVYYFFLLTHIVLATIIVPFVLTSIYYGITNQIERHKKISRYTFPMWLYVALTGVLVYLMIKPFYLS